MSELGVDGKIRFGMYVFSSVAFVLSSLIGGRSESLLRRVLFEDIGGMHPELIARPDINVFLPPIGGPAVCPRVQISFSPSLPFLQSGILHTCMTKQRN